MRISTTWRLGANFATLNHLLINALVLEAFQQVIPGIPESWCTSSATTSPARNRRRQPCVGPSQGRDAGVPGWPRGSRGNALCRDGHPILLPGNPQAGSSVMVADAGARLSCYSVNHGAGRVLGRKAAIRQLDQAAIDQSFDQHDILTNCRQYPKDEAPAAYKDFEEVLRSVKSAGLASEVARLKARFVIKDGDKADD
jgi:tRNA-splicing ligase RtcB (3'-phosphate/5'-hydroxy nucleic acid ligase)